MTKKSGKCRNPTGTTDNYWLPRQGENTKQMKVTIAKESETKGRRQTKLSFLTTGNNISPPTPTGTAALQVITPDDHAGTNRILGKCSELCTDSQTFSKIRTSLVVGVARGFPSVSSLHRLMRLILSQPSRE
jgi:hypothetical protein